jgi:DNA topoisomerase I
MLVPSWTAFSVIRLLEQHLTNLVDYEFTAQMEEFLDAISRHDRARRLSARILLRERHAGAEEAGRGEDQGSRRPRDQPFSAGQRRRSGEHLDEVFLRVGKFGPFLEQGDRRASVPHDMPPDELSLDKALELLDRDSTEDDPLGVARTRASRCT